MEGRSSLLIHSSVHLSIIWVKLWNLFFPAVNVCCNARKWWQWLALKQDGFISTKTGTVNWGTLLFLHPSCCVCISDTSSSSFHVKIYFQGKATHGPIEFTTKNMFALLWGAWVLCRGLQSENTSEIEGNVKLCMIHLYSDLQLLLFTIQAVNFCLSTAKHSSHFSQTEAMSKEARTSLPH